MIGIVIPAHNGKRLIRECPESVLPLEGSPAHAGTTSAVVGLATTWLPLCRLMPTAESSLQGPSPVTG